MPKDLYRLSAAELVAQTSSGALSVEDYVKSLIARIEERQPLVKAWAFFDPELALASARELDAVPLGKRGPLHGVAVGVKDVINTMDMPTQHNSPIYKDSQPGIDASCIKTLRAAGALILGKTQTTEFATCQRGTEARNPHSLESAPRTPGGSSSGSGATVADFQCTISLGTQTGGSVIRPASFNGIFAMKPTWNAINREGLKIYSISCDTLGFYGRSVEDLEMLAAVFALQDDVAPEPTPLRLKGAKFGFVKTSQWPKATQGTQDAWTLGKKLLEAEGALVEEVELPAEFGEAGMVKWYPWVLAGEGRTSFLSEYAGSKDLLDPLIVSHVENATGVTRAQQLEAYDGIAKLRPLIDEIASKYTCLVTPSTTDEAPPLVEPLRFTGDASFNLMWTILHVPVVNIPGFKGPNGFPLGLSLVAPRYHDRALLRVAKAVGPVWGAGGGWSSSL